MAGTGVNIRHCGFTDVFGAFGGKHGQMTGTSADIRHCDIIDILGRGVV
jgi:hypothetical protein